LNQLLPPGTFAATSKGDPQLDRDAATPVRHLVNSNPTAAELNSQALAVLIFPEGNQDRGCSE
jgi:hypothetical protein